MDYFTDHLTVVNHPATFWAKARTEYVKDGWMISRVKESIEWCWQGGVNDRLEIEVIG